MFNSIIIFFAIFMIRIDIKLFKGTPLDFSDEKTIYGFLLILIGIYWFLRLYLQKAEYIKVAAGKSFLLSFLLSILSYIIGVTILVKQDIIGLIIIPISIILLIIFIGFFKYGKMKKKQKPVMQPEQTLFKEQKISKEKIIEYIKDYNDLLCVHLESPDFALTPELLNKIKTIRELEQNFKLSYDNASLKLLIKELGKKYGEFQDKFSIPLLSALTIYTSPGYNKSDDSNWQLFLNKYKSYLDNHTIELPLYNYFRSTPEKLSDIDVKNIISKYGFFDIEFNSSGKGIDHQYIPNLFGKILLVLDVKTGLMWQYDGSPEQMKIEKAFRWIDELNLNCHAGFNDWRLPTLEEAMSLMEPKEKSDLYINYAFDSKQKNIWTSDMMKSELKWWTVDYLNGKCQSQDIDKPNYVRPVRSAHKSSMVYEYFSNSFNAPFIKKKSFDRIESNKLTLCELSKLLQRKQETLKDYIMKFYDFLDIGSEPFNFLFDENLYSQFKIIKNLILAGFEVVEIVDILTQIERKIEAKDKWINLCPINRLNLFLQEILPEIAFTTTRQKIEEIINLYETGKKSPIFRYLPSKLGYGDIERMVKKYNFVTISMGPIITGRNFPHNFEEEEIDGSKVICDNIVKLMWHKYGSEKSIQFRGAQKWIKKLNRENYVGFSDWRMPTLEEIMSMRTKDRPHVDELFDSWHYRSYWTSDYSNGFYWVLYLGSSDNWQIESTSAYHYVTAVRNMKLLD